MITPSYTADQFSADLKEPYAWPGGYPRYFVCSDGAALSFAAAKAQSWQIRHAIRTNDRSTGWRVIGCDINWEDPALYCDHTGARIKAIAFSGNVTVPYEYGTDTTGAHKIAAVALCAKFGWDFDHVSGTLPDHSMVWVKGDK